MPPQTHDAQRHDDCAGLKERTATLTLMSACAEQTTATRMQPAQTSREASRASASWGTQVTAAAESPMLHVLLLAVVQSCAMGTAD